MQKILVIKLRHHGDVLLSTALYSALKQHYPACQLDVLIYKETTPLLEGNPDIDGVLTIDRKMKGLRRLRHELGLVLKVRKARYDAVVHLTDQWIGALLARFSLAPLRIEMFVAKRDRPFWHHSFTHCVTPPPRGQAHAVELNLMCLQHFGIDPKGKRYSPVLIPQDRYMNQAEDKLKQAGISAPFVLIHPAARWPFKCWEDERFAQAISHLTQKGFDVVLTCSPDPVELAMTRHIETLARQSDLHGKSLVNWGGSMSLPLLAALLSKCRFYLGVDSAPMHMAAALDIPQVALFGPSWVNEWRPWSFNATVVYAGDYGPLPHPDSINTDDPTRLLAAIPASAVLKAIDERLAR